MNNTLIIPDKFILTKQLKTQVIINQLFELSFQEDGLHFFLLKAIQLIITLPFSTPIIGGGIFLFNGKKLKLVAQKNVERKILKEARNTKWDQCIWGESAFHKEIRYTEPNTKNGEEYYTGVDNSYGYYNAPVLFRNELIGVVTLCLPSNYVENSLEAESLKVLVNSMGSIMWTKLKEKTWQKNGEDIPLVDDLKVVSQTKEKLKEVYGLKESVDHSADVVFLNTNREIMYVNDNLLKTTGYVEEELIGKSIGVLRSDYHSEEFQENIWTTILSGDVWQGEIKRRRKDGSSYWSFSIISPILNDSGKLIQFLLIGFDVTGIKREKVTSVRAVIETQDQERSRFARDLHDGLGQVLLASKMNLNALETVVKTLDKSSQETYQRALDLLAQATQEARNISHSLMSQALNNFGLVYSVNEMVRLLNASKTAKIEFDHNLIEVRFTEELETGIYRIIQELINIFSNKSSRLMKIRLNYDENTVKLIVFNNEERLKEPETINNELNIKNIETRVECLGGELKLNSIANKGGKVEINIPV